MEIDYKASAEETSYRNETKILQRTQAIQTDWISPPAYCANQTIFPFTQEIEAKVTAPAALAAHTNVKAGVQALSIHCTIHYNRSEIR